MKRIVAVLAGIFTLLAMASATGAEAPCQPGQKCGDKSAPKPQATPRQAPPRQQAAPRPAPSRPQVTEPHQSRRPEVSRPPAGESRQPGGSPARQRVQPPVVAPMSPVVPPTQARPRPELQLPRASTPMVPAPTVQPPTHTGPRTGLHPPQAGAPMAPLAPRVERPPRPHQALAVAHRPRPVEMRHADIRDHHRFYGSEHYHSRGWTVRSVERPIFFVPYQERLYFSSNVIMYGTPIYTYIDDGVSVGYVLYCPPPYLFFFGPAGICPVPWVVRFVVD